MAFTIITSGSIAVGIHYVVANEVDGTGYVTYNGTQYNHGDSFFGQAGVTTFSQSTANVKVYEDTTATDVEIINTAELQDEISPYPEDSQILLINTSENFNENEEVVYPETTGIQIFNTAYNIVLDNQVVRILR